METTEKTSLGIAYDKLRAIDGYDSLSLEAKFAISDIVRELADERFSTGLEKGVEIVKKTYKFNRASASLCSNTITVSSSLLQKHPPLQGRCMRI